MSDSAVASDDDCGAGFDCLPYSAPKHGRPNAIGVLFLALLMVCGLGMSLSSCLKAHAIEERIRAQAASDQRCKEIQPRVVTLVRWNGPLLANPDEVRKLGDELSVGVDVERDSIPGRGPYDTVFVSDPRRPGYNKQLFVLDNLEKGYRDPRAGCMPTRY